MTEPKRLTIYQIDELTDRGKEYFKRAVEEGLISGELHYHEEMIEFPQLTKEQAEELAEALGLDVLEILWQRVKKELNL